MSATAEKIANSTSEDYLPPPLKWAGGKRWLVPTLASIFDHHREMRLVEPFVGGMAVSLGLRPKRALLNDLNSHLINFYQQIKNNLTIAAHELRNERDFYFAQRTRFNTLIQDNLAQSAEAASLFYYLNRTGFNGLCRFNSKGLFNVPFGQYKTIPYLTGFSAYSALFQSWDLSSVDFEKLVVNEDDFLYVDPPYDVQFTRYAKDDFTWKDQERLAEWLSGLRNPMIISNQATERVNKLYERCGFSTHQISAPRRISCTGDREPALELLIYKNISSSLIRLPQ